MKHLIIILTLMLSSKGCKDYERSRDSRNGSSKSQLKIGEHVAKEGELVFTDSNRNTYPIMGAREGCVVRFQENGKVIFSSFAYNICEYRGAFREEDGDILISLDMNKSAGGLAFLDGRIDPDVVALPPLKLQDTPEGLTLIRADGRADFKEHWNIYPWAVEEMFPFRIATPELAEHDATGKPATRSESDSEDGDKLQTESEGRSQ